MVRSKPAPSMRNELGIPDSEVVITMLAVGPMRDEIQVALSPRRPVDEVFHHHQAR